MTTNLTAITSSTSITNNQPSATSRCGLNETGICCKESETPHSVIGDRLALPDDHRSPGRGAEYRPAAGDGGRSAREIGGRSRGTLWAGFLSSGAVAAATPYPSIGPTRHSRLQGYSVCLFCVRLTGCRLGGPREDQYR
jgi:hypothetical protein